MIYLKKPLFFDVQFEVGWCFILCEREILLLKRHENKSYPWYYGIPWWKREQNETPWEWVKREVFEETGIITSPQLFKTIYVEQNGTSFIYRMYIEKVSKKTEIKLTPTEHTWYLRIDTKKSLNLPLVEDTETCIEMFIEEFFTS